MMDGEERRGQIQEMLSNASQPLSGGKLGKIFGVSRQVIVQDIALLRAQGLDIVATARGYILSKDTNQNVSRIIMVQHADEGIEDELNTIVDLGGIVRNVIVEHPIYGELVGSMILKNRSDVRQFVASIQRYKAYPLMQLTNGIHFHTIEASNAETLDRIENELGKKGYVYTES